MPPPTTVDKDMSLIVHSKPNIPLPGLGSLCSWAEIILDVPHPTTGLRAVAHICRPPDRLVASSGPKGTCCVLLGWEGTEDGRQWLARVYRDLDDATRAGVEALRVIRRGIPALNPDVGDEALAGLATDRDWAIRELACQRGGEAVRVAAHLAGHQERRNCDDIVQSLSLVTFLQRGASVR